MQSCSMPQADSAFADGGTRLARLGWSLASLVILVVAWQAIAALAASRLLPGPGEVAQALLRELRSGGLAGHVGVTCARVLASFILAMSIGAAIGIALGRAPRADLFFDSWLIFFLNLPALVIIILCLSLIHI